MFLAFHFLLELSEQSSIFANCKQLLYWFITKLALRHVDRYSTRCSLHLVRFQRCSFVRLSRFATSASEDSRRVGDGVWQRTMRRGATESSRSVDCSHFLNFVSKPIDSARCVYEKRQPRSFRTKTYLSTAIVIGARGGSGGFNTRPKL